MTNSPIFQTPQIRKGVFRFGSPVATGAQLEHWGSTRTTGAHPYQVRSKNLVGQRISLMEEIRRDVKTSWGRLVGWNPMGFTVRVGCTIQTVVRFSRRISSNSNFWRFDCRSLGFCWACWVSIIPLMLEMFFFWYRISSDSSISADSPCAFLDASNLWSQAFFFATKPLSSMDQEGLTAFWDLTLRILTP